MEHTSGTWWAGSSAERWARWEHPCDLHLAGPRSAARSAQMGPATTMEHT
eukprot:CAMPEP_0184973928 /NCGR_PEP_ID=MMETSP1098-20130426/5534_1 /TAXON_ID=89044 /ORGANISM="Spumella elongata, Strain CCAP 955/1" /LENGTH=49 /DNA_ID= /DNA_START= /DNA_END= /DNA_ORIENTATION=